MHPQCVFPGMSNEHASLDAIAGELLSVFVEEVVDGFQQQVVLRHSGSTRGVESRRQQLEPQPRLGKKSQCLPLQPLGFADRSLLHVFFPSQSVAQRPCAATLTNSYSGTGWSPDNNGCDSPRAFAWPLWIAPGSSESLARAPSPQDYDRRLIDCYQYIFIA